MIHRGRFPGLVLAVCLPVAIQAQAALPAVPGTLNYAEGQVLVDGQDLSGQAAGSLAIHAGQVLQTDRGKAELLLTPGVFVRLGDHTAARMISAASNGASFALLKGQALVEAIRVTKDCDIRIIEDDAVSRPVANGLYLLESNPPRVVIFRGKAQIDEGNHQVTARGGSELALGGVLHATRFDVGGSQGASDPLYQWSAARSETLARASADSARIFAAGPAGWKGAGWYWNPYFKSYSFIPETGILYSPFGAGFYPPRLTFETPVMVYTPVAGPGVGTLQPNLVPSSSSHAQPPPNPDLMKVMPGYLGQTDGMMRLPRLGPGAR